MKYSKEITIKLIELEIAAKEKSLGLTDQIITVVRKFDGKVANKRFDTALKGIDPSLRFVMEWNSFKIEMMIENRMTHTGTHTAYIENFDVTIIHGSISSAYGDSMIVNNGINGPLLINGLEKYKTETKEYIKILKKQVAEIDGILEDYQEIKKTEEDFKSRINYMIQYYFELDFKR